MTNPSTNLFHYATKELSQDAVICWLIAWAGQNTSNDPEEEELRRCGRQFVHVLLTHKREKEPIELPEEIATEIHQQDKGIDVLAQINGKQVLLIEDKTGTGDHSRQLERYYGHVEGGHTKLGKIEPENIYPIYFKTGNQPRADDRRIDGGVHGYRVFHRKNFLGVLNGYEGKNPILVDFRQYLQKFENDTNSYEEWTKDGEEWTKNSHKSWRAWQGFFRCLESELDNFEWWGYVPNQSGGFQGFTWWPVDNYPDFPVALVIEGEEKLCFKVWAEEVEDKTQFREDWHRRIMQAGKGQVDRPKRMGYGNTMTVGIWKDWLAFGQDGKLDMQGTVKNLKQAEEVLRAAANSE